MSLRAAIFICATAFLLGVLYTHWIADSLTRWKPPSARSDTGFWTAAAYYRILSNGHPAAGAVVLGAVCIGGGAGIAGLLQGGVTDVMFDGSSTRAFRPPVRATG
jgi:hypothetical protein